MRFNLHIAGKGLLAASLLLSLQACWEAPPMESEQIGYRGVAMWQTTNPDVTDPLVDNNQIPVALPATPDVPGAPKAKDVYQNVQVLGDLSVGEFTRTMASITAWVSPEQGCAYCHQGANFAADDLYTKVVSRRMMQMTQTINSQWNDHVGDTGVTCYTCHRGLNVPEYIWFEQDGPPHARGMAANSYQQNNVAVDAGYTSMLSDPFSKYLVGEPEKIRVAHQNALPLRGQNNNESMQALENTWSLMMHMSDSLGVNCTYCHNSRNFASWEQSPPARVTAWHGLKMVPEINNVYMEPLLPVYPDHRLGPLGDAPKSACNTCHQGVNKPLYGVSMLDDFPVWRAPLSEEATEAPDYSNSPAYLDPNNLPEPSAGLDAGDAVKVAASDLTQQSAAGSASKVD
ncbi:MAG: photosynthetic reaction center cytochrome PufC [Granulosicoccus sp.]